MHHPGFPFNLQPFQDHLSLRHPLVGGPQKLYYAGIIIITIQLIQDNTQIIPPNPSQQAEKAEIQPQKSNIDLILLTFCVT